MIDINHSADQQRKKVDFLLNAIFIIILGGFLFFVWMGYTVIVDHRNLQTAGQAIHGLQQFDLKLGKGFEDLDYQMEVLTESIKSLNK